MDSPAEPAEGANPASTLVQTSGFRPHDRRPCWCFKPSSVWSCVKSGLGMNTAHGWTWLPSLLPCPWPLWMVSPPPVSLRACARVGTTDFQVQNSRATQSCPQAGRQPSMVDKRLVGNGGP